MSQNRLKDSASPYLRSAAHQPIDWYEWGENAFARAKSEDKPLLLDIGAVWCHWCHVIDRESYEDAEVAKIINEHFVPVKVDRDERPDVDSRYQSAISAISGQGGWPLTGFLMPDGRPFYGGTYFPPADQQGRPSFRRVLLAVADAYKNKRGELLKTADALAEAVAKAEVFSGARAEFDAAVATYNGTLSMALREVADAATSRKSLDEELIAARAAVAAAAEAHQMVNSRYEGALATYLDVLSAEDLLISARRSEAELETRALILDVSLVRALGGGFTPDSASAPTHNPQT